MKYLKKYETFSINELMDWATLPTDVNNTLGNNLLSKIDQETKKILSKFNLTQLPIIQTELINLSNTLGCDLETLSNPEELEIVLQNKISSMKFESVKDYIIDNWQVFCKRIGLGKIIGGIIFSIISALFGVEFQTVGTIWIVSNTIGQLIILCGAFGPLMKD